MFLERKTFTISSAVHTKSSKGFEDSVGGGTPPISLVGGTLAAPALLATKNLASSLVVAPTPREAKQGEPSMKPFKLSGF